MTQDTQKRDSFVFYATWHEAISSLPEDLRGKALFAIIEYALTGIESADIDPVAKAMLELVKPQINANRQRYENALKGGNRRNKSANQEATKVENIETKVQPNANQRLTKLLPKNNRPITNHQPKGNLYMIYVI